MDERGETEYRKEEETQISKKQKEKWEVEDDEKRMRKKIKRREIEKERRWDGYRDCVHLRRRRRRTRRRRKRYERGGGGREGGGREGETDDARNVNTWSWPSTLDLLRWVESTIPARTMAEVGS